MPGLLLHETVMLLITLLHEGMHQSFCNKTL